MPGGAGRPVPARGAAQGAACAAGAARPLADGARGRARRAGSSPAGVERREPGGRGRPGGRPAVAPVGDRPRGAAGRGAAAVDGDGRVMTGREAALASALEDRIAVIDGQLAERRAKEMEALNLWRQRADLMQQLVQVRVTRANYVGL